MEHLYWNFVVWIVTVLPLEVFLLYVRFTQLNTVLQYDLADHELFSNVEFFQFFLSYYHTSQSGMRVFGTRQKVVGK